ncbi:LacI family transcriptional regulator [Alloscardovia theropitheci]|uniref:LacI family transcriptional regulator n=1 Tax=Alloscardovia theropitheci TaxID=2496842 RepID=A0A4V6N6W8_9BIFI|nr:LacI family DNA-binding transcriptional regulator [Alloscardovia theropitheci]TCD54559.1 LacI family transcriptional regulator [Alloscardovia theropitheci]
MSQRVTITQIAQEAGVSIKTVSNVLNGTGNMRPSTRARVQEVIDTLGYQVNLAARSMRTGSTKIIGLGIADFSQPFNPYLTDSIINVARSHGYGVITSTYGYHHQTIESILPQTHKLPADGWIFFLGDHVDENSHIFKQNYPVVLATEWNAFDKVDSVSISSYDIIKKVTKRFIQSGKKRIFFAGSAPRQSGENDEDYISRILSAQHGAVNSRARGYLDALNDSGMRIDSRYVRDCMYIDHKNGYELANRLCKDIKSGIVECPDAIICANDALAFGIIRGLSDHDVRVPDDVEIIGFDNVPESQYSNPALTSIDPHINEFARTAVELLIERIEGYDGPIRRRNVECDVHVRSSALNPEFL